ncbi:MAG: hypothetical protein K8R87_09045, partial [Verrucomicrobia bacterium]|nr:hypothetical protein [Verrucomicrobiota bacterium]
PAADAPKVEDKTDEAISATEGTSPPPTMEDAALSEDHMENVVGTDEDFIIDPVEEPSGAKTSSAGDAV